jgi:hypothetical protein
MLCFRLPGLEKPSGLLEKSSPPTVAGAVADLTKPYRIPMSLILRPANLNTRIIRLIWGVSISLARPSHDAALERQCSGQMSQACYIPATCLFFPGVGDADGRPFQCDTFVTGVAVTGSQMTSF